jgi:tetratricopeptide (TPR) repeat protein
MFSIAREISHGQQQKQEVQTKSDLLQKIVTLEAKARSDDTNYAVHLELAKAYYGIGEVQKSKVEFFRAIDLSPEYNYDARYELVKMYLGLNDYQMAKTILYSIPSDNSERYNAIKIPILLQLAEFARDEYKFDDSIDFYELVLNLYPEGSIEASRIKTELSFVYGMIADGYYNKNNLKKTVEYLNQSNSISPNAQSFFKLGMIAESQENLKGAAALYLKAYNLNQGEVSVDVFYNLISTLLKKYKDDLSLPELQTYYVLKRNLEERIGNEILLQIVQISI